MHSFFVDLEASMRLVVVLEVMLVITLQGVRLVFSSCMGVHDFFLVGSNIGLLLSCLRHGKCTWLDCIRLDGRDLAQQELKQSKYQA
mmetsp:Transcript_6275/g.22054  ORF Transcript_6275/g.22054 Transcript_6275/m.22054 type:complete len:87 (+) Transcript_6275:1277-1537(+)